MAEPSRGTDAAAGERELVAPDGRPRAYLLRVPGRGPGPGRGWPLVVALHGGGESAHRFEASSGLSALADSAGFVVVYPQGTGEGPGGRRRRSWNAGRCCGVARRDGVDDVGFVETLVAAVTAEVPIDPNRRLAVGHSNGGMLAFRLALESPGLFAGIGVQSASIAVDTPGPSVPARLIAVHGGSDRHHPIDGGRGPDSRVESPYGSVREACRRFAASWGRSAPVSRSRGEGVVVTDWPADEPGDGPAEGSGEGATGGSGHDPRGGRRDTAGGPGVVRLVEVGPGTHSWMGPTAAAEAARHPARAPAGGPPHAGFDTTRAMWDFLSTSVPDHSTAEVE